VQGVIDLLAVHADAATVVDSKTDRRAWPTS
jgi:ATP-dependent exoDNAse (exonuclease V) beta subunit